MVEKFKKGAVIGSGVMGHGIAQLLAMAGIEVTLVDISDEILLKAKERIKWSLNKFVEKRRIRFEDAEAAFSRVKTTTNYDTAFLDIDLAVEAVPENSDLKKKVFSNLDSLAPQHAILTSNTSTLSITEMGKATKRPDKVAGLHFFNPPQMMALVEVIRGEKTSDQTVNILLHNYWRFTKVLR